MDSPVGNILVLAAKIVSAHVGHNDTDTGSIPGLIRDVYRTLLEVEPDAAAYGQPDTHREARLFDDPHAGHSHRHINHVGHAPFTARRAAGATASSSETVFDDHLVCLEDGMSMKMLKRHLLTVHGLTPEEYREKWGLPDDYPMVASNYAALRSSLAKQSGLGKRLEPRGRAGRPVYPQQSRKRHI